MDIRILRRNFWKARININEAKDGLYLAYVQNENNKQAIAYFEGKEHMPDTDHPWLH